MALIFLGLFFELFVLIEIELFDVLLHFSQQKIDFFDCFIDRSFNSIAYKISKFLNSFDIIHVIFVEEIDHSDISIDFLDIRVFVSKYLIRPINFFIAESFHNSVELEQYACLQFLHICKENFIEFFPFLHLQNTT